MVAGDQKKRWSCRDETNKLKHFNYSACSPVVGLLPCVVCNLVSQEAWVTNIYLKIWSWEISHIFLGGRGTPKTFFFFTGKTEYRFWDTVGVCWFITNWANDNIRLPVESHEASFFLLFIFTKCLLCVSTYMKLVMMKLFNYKQEFLWCQYSVYLCCHACKPLCHQVCVLFRSLCEQYPLRKLMTTCQIVISPLLLLLITVQIWQVLKQQRIWIRMIT